MSPAAIFYLMLLAVVMSPPTIAQELSPQAQLEQRIAAELNTELMTSERATLESCVLAVSFEADMPCVDTRYNYMLKSQTEILHLSETTGDISARASAVLSGDSVLEFQFKPEVEMWLDAYSRFSLDLVEKYPADLPVRFSKFEELSSEFFAKSGLQSRDVTKYCGAELTGGISPHFAIRLKGGQHEDLAEDFTRYAQTYCGQ